MPDVPERTGELDDLKDSASSYIKEAVAWQYNWIALLGMGAFALVSGSALPLVLAAGAELIYLSVVPQSSRFRRLVRSWKYAEEKKKAQLRVAQLMVELPTDLQQRYAHMVDTVGSIRRNYSQLSHSSQMFTSQMDTRLGGLLDSYLRLLHGAHQHGEYLRTTDTDDIVKEIARLERHLEEESEAVQDINRRRIEVLNKRLERYDKVLENSKVLAAQIQALEDLLDLIRDQSFTMKDPQQISEQLDTLVTDVEQTEASIREMEAIYALAGEPSLLSTSAAIPSVARPPSAGPAPRQRTKN
jgi:DNA repair exonuclease SbcCD ATPase subunit